MNRRRIILIFIVLAIGIAAGKRQSSHYTPRDIQYTTTTQTYNSVEECENDPAMLICTEEKP